MSDELRLPPFGVTEAAIEQIEALGGSVLIDVEPGGCCGTAFVFSAPAPNAPAVGSSAPAPQRFGCPGAWLLVAQEARAVLVGATLDYSARIRPPRFRVLRNPNTPQLCPCRRSFGEAWPGAGQPTCHSYLPMPWDDDFDPPERWKRQTGYER